MGAILFPTRRDTLRRERNRRERSGYRVIPGVRFHPPNPKNKDKTIGDYFREQDAAKRKQQEDSRKRHERELQDKKHRELQSKKSDALLKKSRADYASGAKFKSHSGRVGA